jgi:hypothetical protein
MIATRLIGAFAISERLRFRWIQVFTQADIDTQSHPIRS